MATAIVATARPAWVGVYARTNCDLASNHRDEQETSVLCPRILQAALVYVNTLVIQDLLAEPEWVLVTRSPVREVKLNMSSRLPLSTT